MIHPEGMRVVFVYPPIPIRMFDWCAYWDGDEERGHYGYGATADDAVADLLENFPEDAPEYPRCEFCGVRLDSKGDCEACRLAAVVG